MMFLIIVLVLTLLIWRGLDIIALERHRYYMYMMGKKTYEDIKVQNKKDKA